ncbi:melanoma inhibitory activity protein 2-like [Amia ocellicauda]|uniref:melanoma inhibitory activity protein 2-like n=1 Tax=Amia ocellicauda TaxID=2972642 RepID=UPI003464BEC8
MYDVTNSNIHVTNGEVSRHVRQGHCTQLVTLCLAITRAILISAISPTHSCVSLSKNESTSVNTDTKTEEGIKDIVVTATTGTRMTAKVFYSLDVEEVKHAVSFVPGSKMPRPHFSGLPWEVVPLMAFLGGIFILMFLCRAFRSIKSRLYAGKEKKLGQRVTDAFEEKCKVLDVLSERKQKLEQLEADLRNGELAEQAERANLLEMSKDLVQSNREILDELDRIEKDLDSEKASRSEQDDLLAGMQLSLKNMEEEAREQKSQMEQAQTIFKIHEMNRERLKKNLQAAIEENCQLRESEGQLLREAEGWDERLNDLAEQIRMCESSQSSMQEDCSNKDEHIQTLTQRLLKLTDWDSELQEEADGKDNNGKGAPGNGDGLDTHQKQKVQQLLDAAKMNADLRSVVEERNGVFARLADEGKARKDLQERFEKLQADKALLECENARSRSATQKLQEKVQIVAEIHQENELRLHRKLDVEVRGRLQADEAAEELSSYRQRSKALEEELERTEQAYKSQIAAHEKTAHYNWLAARAGDRDLADFRIENCHLRQKITEAQIRLELVEREPSALGVPGSSLLRVRDSVQGPPPTPSPPGCGKCGDQNCPLPRRTSEVGRGTRVSFTRQELCAPFFLFV